MKQKEKERDSWPSAHIFSPVATSTSKQKKTNIKKSSNGLKGVWLFPSRRALISIDLALGPDWGNICRVLLSYAPAFGTSVAHYGLNELM